MAFEENTKPLTTAAGAPVANNQDSMSAGQRGPLLLQDLWLIEKLAHFDREVIPERRMHAKGSGAFGTFRVTHDISRYTKAAIFGQVGNECEMSPGSPPSQASAAPLTPSVTSAGSHCASTPKRATRTWWATTPRCSSSAIR